MNSGSVVALDEHQTEVALRPRFGTAVAHHNVLTEAAAHLRLDAADFLHEHVRELATHAQDGWPHPVHAQ